MFFLFFDGIFWTAFEIVFDYSERKILGEDGCSISAILPCLLHLFLLMLWLGSVGRIFAQFGASGDWGRRLWRAGENIRIDSFELKLGQGLYRPFSCANGPGRLRCADCVPSIRNHGDRCGRRFIVFVIILIIQKRIWRKRRRSLCVAAVAVIVVIVVVAVVTALKIRINIIAVVTAAAAAVVVVVIAAVIAIISKTSG